MMMIRSKRKLCFALAALLLAGIAVLAWGGSEQSSPVAIEPVRSLSSPTPTAALPAIGDTVDDPLAARFAPPAGFKVQPVERNSFAHYLRHLPLKPAGSDLHYYNGDVKQRSYAGAVVDTDFGYGYAEQCADAVIYLRAAWLYHMKRYADIHFNFTNGFRADYSRWARGERIHVNRRTWQCSWRKDANPDTGYRTFRRYLSLVFQYAGTASLEKEMKPIEPSQLTIGDVLINGGYPGHVVIVVDEAVNDKGKKVYLLAQGYTPAQEIEVFGRWFDIDPSSAGIQTPDWYFHSPYARRFR